MNNVRNIAMILTERSITKRWPKLSGKNFVLSLVADDAAGSAVSVALVGSFGSDPK